MRKHAALVSGVLFSYWTGWHQQYQLLYVLFLITIKISKNFDICLPMFFKRIAHYLNPATLFKKGDGNVNLRMMHGINRISIFMFLFCVVVLLVRWIARS